MAAKPSKIQLERHIKHCALDTVNVAFTRHASQRMRERKATPAIVYEVLQSGRLHLEPEPDAMNADALVCRMERCVCGENWAVCVS
ncbi:MAG: DUF4258 domain-containing protein [Gallionellaceae bacterium]|jgi:hypothetical protein|nr:DUF4258 domain-containing protein [Gallionellaceae bacterium]